jgi:hypothetical protein
VVWKRIQRADGERHDTSRDVAVDRGSGRAMEVGSGEGRAGRGGRHSARALVAGLHMRGCGLSMMEFARAGKGTCEVRGIVPGLSSRMAAVSILDTSATVRVGWGVFMASGMEVRRW